MHLQILSDVKQPGVGSRAGSNDLGSRERDSRHGSERPLLGETTVFKPDSVVISCGHETS